MKVVLFIPCYNVADTVIPALDGIPSILLPKIEEILLIDNGSTDETRNRLQEYVSRQHGKFRLFFNEENYRLGGSAVIAIREALKNKADFLICMHSDGQANPQDLEKFFPLSLEEDFIFGSRMLPGSETAAYSRLRWYGNLIFAKLQQIILGQKIYDIGAFVAINLRTLSRYPYFRIKSDMSYFPSLILYIATQTKLRCREFPISWGKVSTTHVNIWNYGMAHLWRLTRLILGLYRLSDQGLSDFRSMEWRSDQE